MSKKKDSIFRINSERGKNIKENIMFFGSITSFIALALTIMQLFGIGGDDFQEPVIIDEPKIHFINNIYNEKKIELQRRSLIELQNNIEFILRESNTNT